MSPSIELRGVEVPMVLYGTAWKEARTARLTALAITQGFRGIDTANQRKHYFEAGVGEAVKEALLSGTVRRDELFIQTKFTAVDGQDHRLPYDRGAPIRTQVEQSFASSLANLGVTYIDSYVLHGPRTAHGLTHDDWESWKAMETLAQSQKTRLLGVSNVNLGQLEALFESATIKPAMVQNRCYASRGWDRPVRQFCTEHGLLYQGFSLLTANREVLSQRVPKEIAARYGKTVAQVVFRLARQLGMIALTGTSSSDHMTEDLSVDDFALTQDEVHSIERIAT